MELSTPQKYGITASDRVLSLRALLARQKCLRVLEAHNPISALLVENMKVRHEDTDVEYDAFWSSSLTDSTSRGKPDIEVLDVASRLQNVAEMFDVTAKPLIFDGDTGGKVEHFVLNVRTLERVGVSAVIIEDKTGLKKNSLFGTEVVQQQEDADVFCEKIRAGKSAQLTSAFMIIARIESLILDKGLSDALLRADKYVAAGADGIMIHSRRRESTEVLEFAAEFRRRHPNVPLVCVPTSFNDVHFDVLRDAGFNVIIYANHMLRAAYQSMRLVASSILRAGRTLDIEHQCLSVQEILTLIPGTK